MLSLLFNGVFAQCEGTNYQPCLEEAKIYREATCIPLQSNSTMYETCLCYNLVNQGFCYQQCTHQTIQEEYQQVQLPRIQQQCQSVGLNHRNLSYPPPWQTYLINTRPVVTSTRITASTTSIIPSTTTVASAVQQSPVSCSSQGTYLNSLFLFVALLQ